MHPQDCLQNRCALRVVQDKVHALHRAAGRAQEQSIQSVLQDQGSTMAAASPFVMSESIQTQCRLTWKKAKMVPPSIPDRSLQHSVII